ncbi:hypothetical protein BTO06_16825 [Tenacibaculum sp. SZ-18]|uniref:hypothetical protein n=1 Tax=Tenacibaculum sp. SZ-18 TaxID=754423 RepID=UPI000C2D355E|nr:hypothetical protein [Tenacibaculum sp. SZ-18]AUC16709.1 hypothetical protein BTO06_16825 [Tenacibaculum sp. SZ-18]
MKNYKITIPEPCHENWNQMTSVEKGRFCNSCSKTVIDFTKKSPKQIQEYLQHNQGKRVCGHFYKRQLDSIVIELPSTIFEREFSFQKMFVLLILVVMGTSLLSCKTEGKTQKIEKIILKDSMETSEKTIDSLFSIIQKESTIKKNEKSIKVPENDSTITVLGALPPPPKTTGIVVELTGEPVLEEYDEPHYFSLIDKVPRFKGVVKRENESWTENFERTMKEYVVKNFHNESYQNLGLATGKRKIFIQIVIGNVGNVEEIKVRAPHPKLREKIQLILKKLPQFIPGENDKRPVKVKYNLPINLMIE